jgi:beta-glucosidase
MKGKTYRYFTGEPLFPFGFGLSYTTFAYQNLRVKDGTVLVDVSNTGPVAGDEVAQQYLKGGGAADDPIRTVEGFKRVTLKPNEKKTVEFSLKPEQIARVGADGRRVPRSGPVELTVGGQTVMLPAEPSR